jgi:parallel beta-helix repeat protein
LEALEDRVTPATFLVVNANDSGAGSLRQAILDANATANTPDTILFDIPGDGAHSIQLASPLPFVTDAAIIDGWSQPGFAGTPLVELDGSLAGANAVGVGIAAADSTVRGLAVNRFSADGINAFGSPNVSIIGNYVGVDPTGTFAEGNGGIGVMVQEGSTGAVIQGNLISGNQNYGIELFRSAGGLIAGNLIGTNAAGTQALGNGTDGIIVANSDNCTIGGADPGARNVISGNGRAGLEVVTPGVTQVLGNYIGTDVTGSLAIGNARWGVVAGGCLLQIGGSATGEGNVISGNGAGVEIDGPGVTIQGNTIGLAAGQAGAVPNTGLGIILPYGGGVVVGGDTPGAGNVIGGNLGGGIDVRSSNNVIQGNWIGVTPSGAVFSNGTGIYLADASTYNQIGGPSPGAGNHIAGNKVQVQLNGTGVTHTKVQGNSLGANVDDTATGDFAGVILNGGTSLNVIGTDGDGSNDAAEGNFIAGNAEAGVEVLAGSANNVIAGNAIGLTADATALGNALGVWIDHAGPNTIGGTAAGAGNVIAFSTHEGVLVDWGNGNAILGNSLHDNGALGIRLDHNGNDNQAAPVQTAATSSGTGAAISGTLAGVANTTFRIEFFSNSSPDPSGYGEGQTYLGFTTATTDAGGNASFTATGLAPVPAGRAYLSATATNLTTNDTSAFSHDGVLAVAAVTSSANPSAFGQPVTLTATVSASATGLGTPTGSVAFRDTTTNTDLGTAALSGGTATLTTSALNAGPHVITATYGGDGTFLGTVATLTQTVTPSILVLNPTASGALSLSGSSSIAIPGNLVVDSSSPTALTETGHASVTAASIRVVGGVSLSGSATLTPTATTGVAAVADPLAGLTGPSTTGLTNYGAVSYTNGAHTLSPGIYTSIKASGTASLTLSPGVYLIEGGGVTVTGSASVSGTGVTLYNTSSNYPSNTGSYGGITLSGNGTFSLTAPTGGPYAGVVLFQARANTRAISLSGGAAAGLGGTVYAPAALLFLGGNASVNGALVVNQLSLTGNAASTQAADAADVSGGDAAGQLLAGDLEVYVSDPNNLFTADELARIQDAVNAVGAAVAPYGVSVTETTDPTAANVTIDTGDTSAVGGYADGILGCYTTAGEVTLLQGWDWYAGSDPSQIGANQYDFQTTVTHELGHALGLGESGDPTSALYGTLAPGTAIRSLTAADLNIPYDDGSADAQRAAPPLSGATPAPVVSTPAGPGRLAGGPSVPAAAAASATPFAGAGSALPPAPRGRVLPSPAAASGLLAADVAGLLSGEGGAARTTEATLAAAPALARPSNSPSAPRLDAVPGLPAGSLLGNGADRGWVADGPLPALAARDWVFANDLGGVTDDGTDAGADDTADAAPPAEE